MSSVPDSISDGIIDLIVPSGSTRYVGLNLDTPGKTGANELDSATAIDYARQPLVEATDLGAKAADATSGGRARLNIVTVDFGTAGSDWGTLKFFTFWDAATGGNCVGTGAITPNQLVVSGNPVSFEPGGLAVVGAGLP